MADQWIVMYNQRRWWYLLQITEKQKRRDGLIFSLKVFLFLARASWMVYSCTVETDMHRVAEAYMNLNYILLTVINFSIWFFRTNELFTLINKIQTIYDSCKLLQYTKILTKIKIVF